MNRGDKCSRCPKGRPKFYYLSKDGTPILICGKHKWLIRGCWQAKPLTQITETEWLKWEQVHNPSQLPKMTVIPHEPEAKT